jgi:hypothetical protein
MFMPSFRSTGLAALASVAILTGCNDAERVPVKPVATEQPAPVPKLAQLSREMVAAVSSGKTASAISVHFALGAPPTVGQPLPVRIAIVPHRKFLAVRGHFEGGDGIPLASGEVFGPKTDVEAETVLEHEFVLMPNKDGLFMVISSLDTDGDEGSVTRIFSIPVIVSRASAETTPQEGAPPAPPSRTNPAAD